MVFSSPAYAAGIYNPAKTKYYTMTAYDTPDKVKPFVETQTQHTYGISTTIGVSTSKTNTLEASGSVSYGVQSYLCHSARKSAFLLLNQKPLPRARAGRFPKHVGQGYTGLRPYFPSAKFSSILFRWRQEKRSVKNASQLRICRKRINPINGYIDMPMWAKIWSS